MQYNTFKFHLTGSRWSMTSSKLCSLRTCQRCSVSIDRSINDLKLIKKFFSATNASADAKEENKSWNNSQLTENHWWNVNLSILESSCYNRSEYILFLAVSLFWLPWLKIFFPSLPHGMATIHAAPKAYLIIIITVPFNLKFVGTLLGFNSMCTCKLWSCHQNPKSAFMFLCQNHPKNNMALLHIKASSHKLKYRLEL